jgi:hypothetical protein
MLYKKYCSGCSLCEASICQDNCSTCFSLCFKRPGAYAHFKDIGGAEIKIEQNRLVRLPEHIPILPDHFKRQPNYGLVPVVAVHGGNMFSSNGERISPNYLNKGYTGALNVDERTKAILQFYVKDRTLEGFWDNRKEIYKDLRKMRFEAVIAPNFSVYEDTPRIDHIYNMKRSSIVYNELLEAGINAVPDIAGYDYKDIDRWCRAINESDVKLIAFSFQTVDIALKASNLWKSYILGFRYLCENISHHVEIILVGIVSPVKIMEIYKATKGQKIHILNQSGYVQSRRGILSQTKKSEPNLTFDQLFEKNSIYYTKAYRDIFSNQGKEESNAKDQEK